MSCYKKSNRPSTNKRSLNKKRTNCSETDDEKELPDRPKQKRLQADSKKCLTRTERILLRIQPPIADREKYIHPEHVNCFLENSERVFMEHSEHRPLRSKQTKACAKDQRKKKTNETKKPVGAVSNDKGEAKTGKETGDEQNEKTEGTKDEDEDKGKFEGTKPKGRAEKDTKKRKTKKKSKQKKSIKGDSDSDVSIWSIDSEVCLIGLTLTNEDKKNIEENRRKVHPPPEKADESVKADENIEKT